MIRNLAAALAALALATPALAQPAPSVANGQALYVASGCYACHGTRGNGGGVAGPRIAPPLPTAAFVSQLRKPLQRMPAYTEAVLSQAQIEDIMAFLRTTPKGRTAEEIPLLRN